MTERPTATPFGHRKVSHSSIVRFAELTGDRSPIHLDAAIGRSAGYGGPIAHGLLTACWGVGALTRDRPESLLIGVEDAFLSSFGLRLSGVVRAEDTFLVRLAESAELIAPQSTGDLAAVVAFETLNQRAEQTSAAHITVHRATRPPELKRPKPWPPLPWQVRSAGRPLYADDFMILGPRGACPPRTTTMAQSIDFAQEVGETNPLYCNESFARASSFGACLVSPMLTFSLAFADFLKDLLSVEMPSQAFAGHIGDRWHLLEPIMLGDTLQTRHQPLSVRRSRSQPGMGIIHFGLQVVNQHDRVVQEGETVMMIPARASASPD